jgi:hypothetical protein
MHSDYGLGFVPAYFYRLLPTFWRNLLPPSSTLKMKTSSSKMLVTTHKTQWCHNPQCYNLHYLKLQIPYIKIATHHSTCLATCSGYLHAHCGLIWYKIKRSPYEWVFTHCHKPFTLMTDGNNCVNIRIYIIQIIFIRGS